MDGTTRRVSAAGEAALRVDGSAARETAFRELTDRQLLASYRLARAILGDPLEAEDATHDAFETAWRKWSTLRDPDRFEAWFGRILVNTCRDRLRRAATGRRVADISARVTVLDDDPIQVVDDRAILREAMEALSADDRVVLALRFHRDLAVERIAKLLGLPAGTVKSRLHHALRRLREHLDATGIEEVTR